MKPALSALPARPQSARQAATGSAMIAQGASLVSWCPEDLVFFFQGFASGKDLASASCVCREFYFASFLAAVHHFEGAFGAKPDPSMPRLKLFHMVDRINNTSEANVRDLMLWSATRGYVKM